MQQVHRGERDRLDDHPPRNVPTVPADLVGMLDVVAQTVVRTLGFGVATVNITRPDGSLEAVSVAGDEQARETLLGSVCTAETWDELLATSEPWGQLRFTDHLSQPGGADRFIWIPDIVPLECENAWHPEDALFAPLTGPDGSRLGILSVDLPRDGMRPDRATCSALEGFAVSTALAIEHAHQESRFRARFEQATTPQALVDMAGRLSSVNDAFCELLGRSRTDLLGMSIAALVHATDSGVGRSMIRSLTSGASGNATYEAVLVHGSGRAVPVLIDVTAVQDPGGNPVELVALLRDLSPVRDAEGRLAKQDARYRALARRASDVAMVTDADVNIVYVSPSVTDVLGYRPEEMLGTDARSYLHPDDLALAPFVEARLNAAVGGVERLKVRIRGAGGDWQWFDETITNCLDDPDIEGLVLNLRDITTEIEAQEDLRRSGARYRAIAETAQEGILVVDGTGGTVFANQMAADILGLSLEQTYQAALRTLFEASPTEELGESRRRSHDFSAERYELPYAHPDGTSRLLALSSAPLPTDFPGSRSSLIMLTDVTERRREAAAVEKARGEALEASRLKSEFLATMSHEIRTPMNGVIGLTGLLLATTLDKTQRQYAEGVQTAGEALLDLINDVLDLSKLDAGKVELEPRVFDLRQLVDEVASLLELAAGSKGLQLLALCSADVPALLLGDSGRIRQVLLNLASNAVKFTEVGRVTIRADSTSTDDGRALVRIEVTDTGIGISAHARLRMFDSFTQADSSTTRRYGGTGLGLAISRQLTHAMGGEIGVHSEVGTGSRFWFQVPLGTADGRSPESMLGSPRDEPLMSPREPGAAAAPHPHGRVLVVEDNALNQLVAEGVVSSLGYQVDIVANGVEALEAITGTYYSAVLMDCHMPVMDGYDATREIRRRQSDGNRVPIIAMTAGARSEDRQRCLAAGMDDYVSKPVDVAVLRAVMERCARRPPGVASPAEASATGASDAGQGDRTARPSIDAQRQQVLRGLGPDDGWGLLPMVAQAFADDCPVVMTALREAVNDDDPNALREAAHRLKGSAANIGLPVVAAISLELEESSRHGALPAPELVERLEVELDRANRLMLRDLPGQLGSARRLDGSR